MTEILNKMEAFEKNGERTLQNERVEHLLEKNALAEKLTENELLVQKLQVEIDVILLNNQGPKLNIIIRRMRRLKKNMP